MKIILMETTNLVPFIIPYVPEGTQISLDNNANETIDTVSGRIRVMGNKALRKLSWASFFPVKNNKNFRPYTAHLNGYAYVTFLEAMRRMELPIRVIGLSNEGIPLFNFLASIDEFTWNLDKSDNIIYKISLTEFPEKFWNFLRRDRDAAGKIWNDIFHTRTKEKLIKAGLLIENL